MIEKNRKINKVLILMLQFKFLRQVLVMDLINADTILYFSYIHCFFRRQLEYF